MRSRAHVVALWSLLIVVVHAGNKFRRVCYFSSWAIYRPSNGKYSPSDIDPFLCTHIIYAFAKLNEETFVLETFDAWADLEENYGLGGYVKVTSLRNQNPRLKVMISVGGWNAGSQAFSDMVSIRLRRKTFIDSVLKFMRKHKFDGLDINWEFPGVRGGKDSDKVNFDLFVQELRTAVDSEPSVSGKSRLLISAAVSASEKTVTTAYNPASLGKHLDFVSIMTYDFHGSWDANVEHHSPIYGRFRDPSTTAGFNMVAAVKLWLNSGCPADKIVVGVPFYGRSFTLTDPVVTTPGALASGGGEPGPFTREPGFLAYFEVCSLLMDSTWAVVVDPEERAPYAVKEDQWIGYDDIDSIVKKTVIVREWGLGGVMIWSVDMDDFRGLCNSQSYPLLRMIKKVLDFQPVRIQNIIPAFPLTVAHTHSNQGQQQQQHQNFQEDQPTFPPRLLPPPTTPAPSMVPFNNERQPLPTPFNPPRPFIPPSAALVQQPPPLLLPPQSFLLNNPHPVEQPPENPWNHQLDFGLFVNRILGEPPSASTPADMTAADSVNTGMVGFSNPNMEFRPMECPNEGFFRNPEDCTRFYRCTQSFGSWMVYHFLCPHGLVFDTSHNTCNWISMAGPCRR